jgi:hypothetical protein
MIQEQTVSSLGSMAEEGARSALNKEQ